MNPLYINNGRCRDSDAVEGPPAAENPFKDYQNF